MLNVPTLVILDSGGKSLAFQTRGDEDVDTNHQHHHPPFISTPQPNITQKAVWRLRKGELIDCLLWLTHEQSPEKDKHIFLVVVELDTSVFQSTILDRCY